MQKKKSGVKKCLEICAIKGGEGGDRRLMAKTILYFHFDYLKPSLTSVSKAAMAAANGNVHEKAWKKAVSYLELAIPGVRWSHFPFNKM